MNKNSQYLITLACLVIAGSVVYYLFSYLPERNKVSLQLSLQKECLDLGSKRYKEDHKDGELMPDGSVFTSEYIFNKTTSDCLYRSIYLGSSGIMTKDITDLFTNKSIGNYTIDKDSNVVDGDQGEYLFAERTHF